MVVHCPDFRNYLANNQTHLICGGSLEYDSDKEAGLCMIRDSCCSDNEDHCLLGCDTTHSGTS